MLVYVSRPGSAAMETCGELTGECGFTDATSNWGASWPCASGTLGPRIARPASQDSAARREKRLWMGAIERNRPAIGRRPFVDGSRSCERCEDGARGKGQVSRIFSRAGSDTISWMHGVTELLNRWSGGDREALSELIPIVYQELRRISRQQLYREGHACTLQTTALVHEAYLRLEIG